MPEGPFAVELWDGKKVVGVVSLNLNYLPADYIVITVSPGVLKEVYGKKYEQIKLPVVYRVTQQTKTDITLRQCLDVRRKSKRQIHLVLAMAGFGGSA